MTPETQALDALPPLDMAHFEEFFPDAAEAAPPASTSPEAAPAGSTEAAPVAPTEPVATESPVDVRLRALAILEAEQRAKKLAARAEAEATAPAAVNPVDVEAQLMAQFRADPAGFAARAGLTPEQYTEHATALFYAGQPAEKVPTEYKQTQTEAAMRRELAAVKAELAQASMQQRAMLHAAEIKTTVLTDESFPLVREQMRKDAHGTLQALCEVTDRLSGEGPWVSPHVAAQEFERVLQSLRPAAPVTPTAPAPAATTRAPARTLTNSDNQPTTRSRRAPVGADYYAELARMIPPKAPRG